MKAPVEAKRRPEIYDVVPCNELKIYDSTYSMTIS